jgi:hypothetical protein
LAALIDRKKNDARIDELFALHTIVGVNRVLQANLDLEDFAAELGVMQPWKALGD